MPGFWDEDDFQESGFASIKRFSGILVDVEDDIEGDYGSQIAFHYEEVELLEAGDDVTLDEQKFTRWIKQSSRTNSTNQQVVKGFRKFKDDQSLDGDMAYFKFAQGLRLVYELQTYDFGAKINPGTAFIPVDLADLDEKPAKASSKRSKAVVEDTEEIDEKLVKKILDAVDEEGLTAALIKATLNKKASTRKMLDASGGIKTVLSALVDGGVLEEDEGVFGLPSKEMEDEDEDDEDDEDLV